MTKESRDYLQYTQLNLTARSKSLKMSNARYF